MYTKDIKIEIVCMFFNKRKTIVLLCLLFIFFNLVGYTQMSVTFTTSINTICDGEDCQYEGPSILINEIQISPTSSDGSLSGSASGLDGKGEWIELYNPDLCEPADISCYFLGNNTEYSAGFINRSGGFRIPEGTIVPPGGFCLIRGVNAPVVPSANLVQNGGNVVQITVPANVNGQGVCVAPGETRLWFPNAGGWFAFYDKEGVPQDAVSWGSMAGTNGQPCLPNSNSCIVSGSLSSYNNIPEGRKNKVYNTAVPNSWGHSIRRMPDGGDWVINQGAPTSTPGDCNADCIPAGFSSCNGTATVNVIGGTPPYSYSWNDSQAQTASTATALCAGLYHVTVTDAMGISQIFSIEIEDFVPEVSFSLPSEVCDYGQSILFSDINPTLTNDATGIFTGTGADGNAFNVALSGTGTFDVLYTYTDENGCTNQNTQTITVHPVPDAQISGISDKYCLEDALINIITSPAGGILEGSGIDGNSFNPQIAGVGNHTLTYTMTNSFGCSTITEVIVQISKTPEIVVQDLKICFGSTRNLNEAVINNPEQAEITFYSTQSAAENGYNSIDQEVGLEGIFWIRAESPENSDCFALYSVQTSIIQLSYNAMISPEVCYRADGAIELSVSGGVAPYQYSADGGQTFQSSSNFEELTSGNYSIVIKDNNDCEVFGIEQVGVIGIPEIDAGDDIEVCKYDQAVLTATYFPSETIIWWENGIQNGEPFDTPYSGVFPFIVHADWNDCIVTDTAWITVNPLPQIDAGSDLFICEGDEVILNAFGGISYEWSNGLDNGDTFVPPLGSSVFTVIGTSNKGCQQTDSFMVTVEPYPIVSFAADTTLGCSPFKVYFSSQSDQEVDCFYSFGDGTTSNDCNSTHVFVTGDYTVSFTAQNYAGCATTLVQEDLIHVIPQPIADFAPYPDTLNGYVNTIHFINYSTNGNVYLWDFGDGTSSNNFHAFHTFEEEKDQIVQFSVQNELGCADTAIWVIPFVEDIVYYVPNTFTPDKDDYNEIFKPIFTSGFDPYEYHLTLFNRWGEILFESFDPSEGWDGTYGGKIAKEDVYVWKIEFKILHLDKHKVIMGHLNLLK